MPLLCGGWIFLCLFFSGDVVPCGVAHHRAMLRNALRRLCLDCALRQSTYENTPPFMPRVSFGKVVRVYDGDTLHLAFFHGMRAQRIRVRLLGFDCAEMRTTDPDEKAVALRSKQLLEEQVLGSIVRLHAPLQWDKYGRLLADLSTPRIPSIRDWMIEHADGIPYDGGTKTRVDWSQRLSNRRS